jgi:hypothetical protein
VAREFNVIALIKGVERYVFVYDDDSRAALVEALHEQAADPHLSLNWFDAAVLTQKAQEQAASKPAVAVSEEEGTTETQRHREDRRRI